MSRRLLHVAGLALIVATLRAAPQAPSPAAVEPQATFRSRVDLMQLDVSVLDKDRRPVKGLTAANFTILEDGKPRKVETLLEVDVPVAAAGAAVWRDAVAQDVTSNRAVESARRVVVILIDDNSVARSGQLDMRIVQKTRDVARRAVTDLGAADLAAVVHTRDNFTSQTLTTDHRRLLTAIESDAVFPGGNGEDPTGSTSGECWCNLCTPETLDNVAKALKTIPNLRKTVLYVSAGIIPPRPSSECHPFYIRALQNAFRNAQLANVNIHSFDPTGLLVSPKGNVADREGSNAGTQTGTAGYSAVGISDRVQYLRTVTESTGGRAIVNSNDPEQRVSEVLDESRSYYLVGFTPADLKPDGRTRKLDVRVNHAGLTVEARKGFLIPAASPPGNAKPSGLAAADASALLPGTSIALQGTAAAFAQRDGTAVAVLVLGMTVPERVITARPVDIVARVIDQFGGSPGTLRQTLKFAATAGDADRQYELLSKLPLRPGRYDIRMSVDTGGAETSGVYVTVDVPNFSSDLSASGLVLGATPSPPRVSASAINDLLPIVPTTRRDFHAGDRVTAFIRAYQDGTRPAPTATVELRDAAGRVVTTARTRLEQSTFGGLHVSDWTGDLPVATLAPDEYSLSVTLAEGSNIVRRALRFRVQ